MPLPRENYPEACSIQDSVCDKEWQSPLSQWVNSHCPITSITTKQCSCNVELLLYLPLFCHHIDWLSLVKEFETGDI